MTVPRIDILRSAKLMIKNHGSGAWIECASKHRELLAEGDEEGARVWLEIAEVIARWDDMGETDSIH